MLRKCLHENIINAYELTTSPCRKTSQLYDYIAKCHHEMITNCIPVQSIANGYNKHTNKTIPSDFVYGTPFDSITEICQSLYLNMVGFHPGLT